MVDNAKTMNGESQFARGDQLTGKAVILSSWPKQALHNLPCKGKIVLL